MRRHPAGPHSVGGVALLKSAAGAVMPIAWIGGDAAGTPLEDEA